MGEIADMILDGTLDQDTGAFLGEPVGYPRTGGDPTLRPSRAAKRRARRKRRDDAKRISRERRLINDASPLFLRSLKAIVSIADESDGVAGYHLNGAVAEWAEFPEMNVARAVIAMAEGR